MKETVWNIEKKSVGEVDLSEEIFTEKVNKGLIYEVVKMQLANRRQGDAATKTRGMVSGTTAKMYRQKGTGRARHGDAKANIFIGGGKSFGPHPRDYSYKAPKKVKRGGLKAALSLKKNDGKFLVVDKLEMSKIKTKEMVNLFTKLGVKDSLVVVDSPSVNLEKSIRNVHGFKLLGWEGLNVFDLMKYEHVIITLPALAKVQEVLGS